MQDGKKQPKIFYGWWIVVSCFVNGILLGGFVTMGFTAFVDPIANDLHWSYAQISIAASLRGVEVALFAPAIGYIVDRWGPRRVMLTGIIFISFSLVFLSYVYTLPMFYLGFIIMSLGVGGNSPTVVMTTMANWFRKKLGLATGLIGSGFALGGLLIPLVVRLIDIYDWRTALFILGIATFVIGVPISLLLRHKPEQYGYLPDGEQNIITADARITEEEKEPEIEIGTKQALKSRAFWYITVAMTFQIIATNTVSIHVMPSLNSVNISRATASLVATAVPLLSIAGRLSSGWMADGYNIKGVSVGFFLTLVVGLLSIGYISSEAMWLVFPFVICFGIGWGGNNTLRVNMMNQYFGRARFGSIFGIMMGINALAGLLGPYFAGWAYDNWGSYRIAWLSLAMLVFVSIIVIVMLPPKSASITSAGRQ
jgi:MFS family permease